MRRTIPWILTLLAFASFHPVAAQQRQNVPRIAYLSGNSPLTNADRIEAFRQGLRELGYIEGQNIAVEYRFADGKLERLPGLAAELVRLQVDLIVVGGGNNVIRAASNSTKNNSDSNGRKWNRSCCGRAR